MSLLQAIFLGILQGVTEFLPVSSSGHLVLGQSLLGLNPESLKSFDIAIHFGTLLALLVYFRNDFLDLFKAAGQTIGINKPKNIEGEKTLKEQQKLIICLVLAMIPAVIIGAKWGDFLDAHFLNPLSVVTMFIVMGFVFLLAEWVERRVKNKKELTIGMAVVVGCAQSVALISGVSRSGATISAGLFLGMERSKAAKFSFLLGSVAIFAATVLAVYKGIKGEFSFPPLEILVTGILSSFAAGVFTINLLMKYLRKHSLAVFAYYRWAIAAIYLISYFTVIK